MVENKRFLGISGRSLLFIILFSFSCIITSVVIPPFQSPDEFHHIRRAYTFSHGLLINEISGNTSGGSIDTGLELYFTKFNHLPFHPEKKINQAIKQEAKSIKWSGSYQFSGFPNTAVYFPLSYLPQAIAIKVGELFDLTVNKTYYLARYFSLLTIIILLYFSFRITEPHPLVYFLLMLPISIFQCSSASTDGLHFSMTIIIMSFFVYMYEKGYNAFFLFLMSLFIFILATHRINFFLMTFFPMFLWFYDNNKKYIYSSIILISSVLLWIFIAMKMTALPFRPVSMFEIAIYYICNPLETIKIFISTFTNVDLLTFYWKSFIGILGWLDYSIHRYALRNIAIVIFLILLLYSCITRIKRIYILTLISSLLITLSVYFILLVQWTRFPNAIVIEGVQGRYFIPILILASYSLVMQKCSLKKEYLFYLIFTAYSCYSLYNVIDSSIQRYFIG